MREAGDAGVSAKQMDAIDAKLQAVEYSLFQKALAASDDKYYTSTWKSYYNLLWLNGEIGTGAGDVAGGGDYGPTDTAPVLLDGIEKNIAAATVGYQTVMARDVPAFNRLLAAKGKSPLITTLPPESADADDADANDDFADADDDG
jgi:hypothetical protein